MKQGGVTTQQSNEGKRMGGKSRRFWGTPDKISNWQFAIGPILAPSEPQG
jgi:hypothetical protein